MLCVPDGVAFGMDALHDFGELFRMRADEEIGRLQAIGLENVEHLFGVDGARRIVESQHDFLVAERQRLWILE